MQHRRKKKLLGKGISSIRIATEDFVSQKIGQPDEFIQL